ncbi:hypothetical protein IEO21_05662 [Rhodonia placenta]|uniref:Glycoside hydrolase family 3 N-terminal domain-containing protein n=1 Tax=Rhodonia placenta TaxID=104341 RepID=A0A8H7U1B1_9APHY|nr:hypothetical protein IEO21_05662 [Postia placenta]
MHHPTKREIGQHFLFGFHGHHVSDDIRTLICDYYLGNVILMKRNVQSIAQVQALVTDLQRLAKEAGHERPLMIGIDQENGLVSAFSSTAHADAGTQFPGAMALAATGSVQLAEQVSAASGAEMRLAGINWAYSPVADVNNDPRNPVIGVRSFGDDPQDVSRYVQAVSRGLTSAGIAPSAKHFPGHGNTHTDSHLSLPVIEATRESLDATELPPFKALIDSGVASIMTGHMALPLITGDATPASLSRAVTTDLLRDALGFRGVIVTDCLEMDAVAATAGVAPGAVRALQAGADVVMICHRFDRHLAALNATYDAVRAGVLPAAALAESGRRIAAMKDAFTGGWDAVLGAKLDAGQVRRLKTDNALLGTQAYARTVAPLRPLRPGALPLAKAGHAVLFTPRVQSINPAVDDNEGALRDAAGRLRNTAGPSYEALSKSLAAHVPVHHIVYAPGDTVVPSDQEKIRGASSLVFAVRNAFEAGAWQIDYLRAVVQDGVVAPEKLVLVTTCAPYDLMNLDMSEVKDVPCLATFEFTVPAMAALADVLFGVSEAKGTLPVGKA